MEIPKELNYFPAIATLVLVAITSLLDAVSTLIVIALGLAVEANPLMDMILQYDAVAFLAIKVLWPTALIMAMYWVHKGWGQILGLFAACLYGMVTLTTLSQLLTNILQTIRITLP